MPLDVEPSRVQGVWWRHVVSGGDIWYWPDPAPDGRWQRGEVIGAFYAADSEETAWAEWYRALSELGIPPAQALPRDLWRLRVDLPHVADLSTPARLERVGLPAPRPVRSDWPAFQEVGHALAAEGWAGILYPSAGRPEQGDALAIFRVGPRVVGVSPIRPPRRQVEPPALPRGMRT